MSLEPPRIGFELKRAPCDFWRPNALCRAGYPLFWTELNLKTLCCFVQFFDYVMMCVMQELMLVLKLYEICVFNLYTRKLIETK